jgi:hypothetical protein
MFPRRRSALGKVFLAVFVAFLTVMPFLSLFDVMRYHRLVVDGLSAPGVVTSVSTSGRGESQTYEATYEFEDQQGRHRTDDERIDRAEYERYSSQSKYPVAVRYVPSARHNSTLDISRRQSEARKSVVFGFGAALIVAIMGFFDQSAYFPRRRADRYRRLAAMYRTLRWRKARDPSSAPEWVAYYDRLEKELRKSEKKERARVDSLLAHTRRPTPPRRSVVQPG